MTDDDDETAAELLDEVDLRTVSVIWNEADDQPEVAFSGCSVYEAIGLSFVALFRLLATEAYPYTDDDDDEEEDDE